MRIRMSQLIVIFVIVLVAVAGCTSQAVQPNPTEEPPAPPTATSVPVSAAVVGFAERLNAGDLEGALAYFDDSAMFYVLGLPPTGTEILTGKEQIRTMLEENIASHFKMEVEVLSVVGDVVNARTTTWHDFTRELGVAPLEATEVYVIEDGKIATEAWHVSEESLAKLKTALAEAMPAEPEPAPAVDAPVSEMTVTFADGTCTYDDSLALQAGQITVTMDVQDRDKEKYAFTAFNLAPDKDFADLMASTIQAGPPSWADLLSLHEALPGENSQFNITIEKGPVYLVCWSKPPDLAIGSIGPFAVAE
jgi:hypothetical protein